MRLSFFRYALVFAALSSAWDAAAGQASPSAAPTQTAVVEGTVRAPDGRRASGATLVLDDSVRTTVADSAGRFRFTGLAPGRHRVVARDRGATSAPRVASVRAGETLTVDLQLRAVELTRVVVRGERAARARTGSKADVALAEAPYSVSVVTSGDIAAQKVLSVNEAVRYTAGVQAEQYGGLDNAFDFIVVRGLFVGSDGLFRDGLQLATPGFVGFRTEPYALESLEVLKGAASVLYGLGTPGGMINAISKAPADAARREVIADAGSFGLGQGRVDVNQPFARRADGAFAAVRVLGLRRSAGTQADFGRNDRSFLAPSLAWVSPTTSVVLRTEWQRDRAGHFDFLPRVGTLDPSPNGRIPASRTDAEPAFNGYHRDQQAVALQLDRRAGARWTFRHIARYDRAKAAYEDVFGGALDTADRRLLTRSTFTAAGTTTALSTDNQLHGALTTGAVSHAFLVGADVQRYRFDEADGIGPAPSLDIYAPRYGAPVERPANYADALTRRTQVGLYVFDRARVGERLAVSAGLRQNFVSSSTEDRLAAASDRQRQQKLRAQAGLAYVAPRGLTPHVGYSESYLPILGRGADGRPFRPETGRQVEAGLRYARDDRPVRVSVAAFDLRRQNVRTPAPDNPQLQVQTGEVRSRGVEAEATVRVARGVSVSAAYTGQDVEVTRSNGPDLGKRPVAVANTLTSARVDGTRPGPARTTVSWQGGARYQGPTPGDAANSFSVPGATLVDAMLGVERRGVRAALNAQNLLDRSFVAGCSDATCFYGRRRVVNVSLQYVW